MSERDREASKMRGPWPTRVCRTIIKILDTWCLLKTVFKYLFRSSQYCALEYISLILSCLCGLSADKCLRIILSNISEPLSNPVCTIN